MGLFLYNLSITFMDLAVRAISLFNGKARLFVRGRKDLLTGIAEAFENNPSPVAWFHCASLGEFEQGRPVIEAFKKAFPAYKVLLTFFSPSGYEVRKKYAQADYIFYLPVDTRANATKFIKLTNPKIAFFVKYEFWHHYLMQLSDNNIPAISISAIFRPEQLFFKSYGGFYRNILKKFDHLFVQNQRSVNLLKGIGIAEATLAGDTRFDRVGEIAKSVQEIPAVKEFKGDSLLMVVGSSWPEDMEVLLPVINKNPYQYKFVIAPHEIHENTIARLEDQAGKSIRFSQCPGADIKNYDVLIIDNVGMLSSLYQYGDLAYIGGAFGKGLHNILEAATFGMPLLFGDKNYAKFQEARDLIALGGAFPVSGTHDLLAKMERLHKPAERAEAAKVSAHYVTENTGATEKIMAYCKKFLES